MDSHEDRRARRMSLPFRPLGNRVVIKADVEDHAPEQTASGLLTATSLAAAVEGSDKEDSWFVGTIVGLGPLVDHTDPLHVGDRVTFSWASGQQITADGEKYLIMRDKDVLAVLEEANG